MSLIVIGEACQYCSRQLSPADILRAAGGHMRMCHACHDVHSKTLQKFGEGEVPRECGGCLRTFDDLIAAAPGGNLRMSIVWKDKQYQVLCGTCADLYMPKRGDLFKGTEFGRNTLNL